MLWVIAGCMFLYATVMGVQMTIEATELFRAFHPYGPDRRWVFGKLVMGLALFVGGSGGIALLVWLHDLAAHP